MVRTTWRSHGHQSKVPLVFYIYSQRINTKPNGKLKWSEDRKRDIFLVPKLYLQNEFVYNAVDGFLTEAQYFGTVSLF